MIPELAALQLKLNDREASWLLALFAHNMTVAARASGGEPQLRALNEIVHRLTSELASQLRGRSAFGADLLVVVDELAQLSGVSTDVAWAASATLNTLA